jgi:hypothetical protein
LPMAADAYAIRNAIRVAKQAAEKEYCGRQ